MPRGPPIAMRQDLEHIDSEAADWFLRRQAGLSPAEEEAYQRWLEGDPRRAERMRRHESSWDRFAPLEESFALGEIELEELLPPPARRFLPRRSFLAATIGLAAAIALFALLYPRFVADQAQQDLVYQESIATATYSSRILPDGSIVELNADTRLRVRYTDSERALWLEQGEAHFDVAKDSLRPFVVHAGDTVVRALGTAFNIRLTDQAVEILVTEGLVQFGHSEPAASGARMPLAAQMAANQQSVIPKAAPPTRPVVESLSPDQVQQRLAWKPEILEFSSATLAQVVQAFNKRNETQLVIADPQLQDMPIEISFRAGNVESFARLLELAYDIQTEHRPQSHQILLTQRP